MNKLACAAALGAALTGSIAKADTIEEAIGNTVVVRLADGSVERYLFDADNTFTVILADGEVSGTWAIKGEKICIYVGEEEPICDNYPKGKKLGDSWTEVDDDDGSTLTISIEPGR